jgi:hypothetical protein
MQKSTSDSKKLKESISQIYGSLNKLSLAVGFIPDVNTKTDKVEIVKADDGTEEIVDVIIVQDQIEALQNALITLAQAISWNKSDIDYNSQRISNLSSQLWDYISQHAQGHLPKIQGAAQMASVLKKLGMDKDYTVQPQTVYASCDGKMTSFSLNFIPKK